MSNFAERLLVSFGVIVVVFLTIFFSDIPAVRPIFTLVTSAIICVALWEFYHIAKGKGYEPLSRLGIVGSVGYLYALYLSIELPHLTLLPFFILFLILFIGFLSYIFRGEKPLSNLAVTFFGLVYLTIPLGLMISINFEFGRKYLLLLLLITKLTDTGAYFMGKKFGNLKFAPYISPNKTWEGALGGFALGLGASLLISPFMGISFAAAAILGSLLSLSSIFGDLTESLLKRDLGVKDSNHLPGLGGFLDVLDSLVFATPLLYFYLKLGSTLA